MPVVQALAKIRKNKMITYIYDLSDCLIGDCLKEFSFNNDDDMREHLSLLIRSSNTLSINNVLYKDTGKTVEGYNKALTEYYGC